MPRFVIKPVAKKTYIITQNNKPVIVHGRSPYPNVETGTWFYFDDTQGEFVDSGFPYSMPEKLSNSLTINGKQYDGSSPVELVIEEFSTEKLSAAVDTALEQARESGEFDGADGITPHIGDNGNWYIGSVDTSIPSRGEAGQPGRDGQDGLNGKDGANGQDGKDGVDGADGYTPVKGTDYFTEEDKTELVNSVLAALPMWEGGSY